MATTAFGLTRIGQVAVRVHDLDRAIAFYRDTLGLRFLFRAPPALAFFDCDGVRLLIEVPQDPAFDHPASVIYYSVPDIRAAHQALLARGVRFLRDPHLIANLGSVEVWMAFFRDPDENVLALMSEVPVVGGPEKGSAPEPP
ncbi:MAG TPA: VOC family protein [Vicinamibacteria bacterium]|nr:VOC family protein [Vicinamibacteria bacterium]